MRRLLLPTLLALLSLALPASASAHATLVGSRPANGAVLVQPPERVVLLFDDTIQPAAGTEAVRDGGGSVLAGKPFRPAGNARRLVIPLRENLPHGDYSVRWRVVSDDGHAIVGVLAFAVGPGRASPLPVLSAGAGGPGAGGVVSRWLFLIGLLVAAGSVLFRHLVWHRALSETHSEQVDPAGLLLQTRAVAAGAALALLGSLLLLGLNADARATRFGRVTEAAAVLAAATLLVALAALARPRLAPLAALASLLLLVTPALAGHALDPGRSRPLAVASDAVHLAAVSAWLGGIVQLAVVVPRAARSLEGMQRGRLYAAVARRFSTLALLAVLVLSASGAFRALTELSALHQLWTTSYGQMLLVKSGLLGLLLVLGWLNRHRLVPGLMAASGRNPAALRAFARLRSRVVVELALLVLAVAAVAVLTSLRPGQGSAAPAPSSAAVVAPAVPRPPRGALVLAQQARDLAVGLALRPAGRGLEVQASVLGPNGAGFGGLKIGFRLGGASAAGEPCGPGCYRATLAASGDRRLLGLSLDGPGRRSSLLRFVLPARLLPPRADALVRRATRVYRSLSSLVIHERLASGPDNVELATYELAAPNRLAYRIRGGPQAILIGERRWDRSPGGRWQASAASPSRQPVPFWGPGWIDARLLGSSRVAGRAVRVVSFFDPGVPAWFTLSIDRRSFRTLDLRMVAAAHFMHHRYGSFDRPLRIRPPG